MLIINFEGREAKGLSKGRYDETFAGEDGYHWLVMNAALYYRQVMKGRIMLQHDTISRL